MSRTTTVGALRLGLVRSARAFLLGATLLLIAPVESVVAQSASATLTGTVVDTSGAVIAGATIVATHEATSARRRTQSAADGSFILTTLTPGRYVVVVTQRGFQQTEVRDIVLNVDDRQALRVELAVASIGEDVTVTSDAPRINTSSAVSTVIDRRFVENLPLNGRSLQALLALAPGVTFTASVPVEGGQFSVNGQRSTDNYFMVDGVSANAGTTTSATGFLGAAGSGQVPALTSLGGTNGLVSVDALQEFRLQTSTYAPEFGRVPGGQISLVTRSGTNTLHGSAFEYFRDEVLDANDWFANRSGEEPELKQHNFGGVLGGPIIRDRTFAFGSYEGLRLLLPQAKTVTVPTQALRDAALPAIRPFLAALPLPNGRDVGGGFGDFLAVYSDPSTLHSTSVRVDHNLGSAWRFFGRISDARSSSETRAGSLGYANVVDSRSQSVTLGSTWVISDRMVHDLRANVTSSEGPLHARQDPIGGAVALPSGPLPSGRDPETTLMSFSVTGGGSWSSGPTVDLPTHQFNIVDSLTLTTRRHELKVGLDFRSTSNTAKGDGGIERYFFDAAGLRSGQLTQVSLSFRNPDDRTAVFRNLSLYAQDHWRMTSRLSVSYGVRWDVLPSPHATSGPQHVTLDRTSDLYNGSVGLAAPGTPLWKTRYTNLAPRLGGSYVISENPATSLVMRGGIGIFYGLGYGQIADAFGQSYPFLATRNQPNVPFPVAASLYEPPVFGITPPGQIFITDRDLEQPNTVQWNVTAEQGLGRNRSLTAGFVGANGHKLLKLDKYLLRLNEWPTSNVSVYVNTNAGLSDYRALQLQFQQRMRGGIQAIASYTLSRSRDTGSSDVTMSVPVERLPAAVEYGYSNFDVRHVFSAAFTYQTSGSRGPRVWRALSRDVGIDLMVRGRSGYPVNVVATIPFPPDMQSVRTNVVAGQPFWIDDPTAPGGRVLNRQAFVIPPAGTQGNLRRGEIRGFGMTQVDLALRREITLRLPLRLQLRFEAFNLFNTPNFGDPITTLTSAQFGQSTSMLGRSLGGQNALYQMGGPRSLQIAVKALF